MPTSRTWVDNATGEIITITWLDKSTPRYMARAEIATQFLKCIGPNAVLADYEEIEED